MKNDVRDSEQHAVCGNQAPGLHRTRATRQRAKRKNKQAVVMIVEKEQKAHL